MSATSSLPELTAGNERHVLFSLPLNTQSNGPPKPHPEQYEDHWDDDHVHMPCSDRNILNNGSKWQLIQESLQKISSVIELEAMIKKYSPGMANKDFDVLRQVLYDIFPNGNQDFSSFLAEMVRLALSLPRVVTRSVPLLRQRQNATLFLSQQQVACLMANAFLCTFPGRNECSNKLPSINFFKYFTLQAIEFSDC